MDEAKTVVEQCYAAYGADCWITSGSERTTVHHGQPVAGGAEDPHYEGKALDFRLWHVPAGSREALVGQIRQALGYDYVVLWEGRGTANEHVHCQHGHIVTA